MTNTTAEELAHWLARGMAASAQARHRGPLGEHVEIGVDGSDGQWGYCRLTVVKGVVVGIISRLALATVLLF
jgi:hypothetical protein